MKRFLFVVISIALLSSLFPLKTFASANITLLSEQQNISVVESVIVDMVLSANNSPTPLDLYFWVETQSVSFYLGKGLSFYPQVTPLVKGIHTSNIAIRVFGPAEPGGCSLFGSVTLPQGEYDFNAMLIESATGLVISSSSVPISVCTNASSQTADFTEIIQKLKNWRDSVASNIDPTIKAKIEAEAATYPTDLEDGSPEITIETDGETKSVKVHRKDWLYALYATEYTLMGLLENNNTELLDTGFWLFLQAAILHPEEPEHISNIVFHLNRRKQFNDALWLAGYADENLDPYAGIVNNMAYAKASLGDLDGAVAEACKATAYSSGSDMFFDRLAAYYKLAGMDEAAESIIKDIDNIPPLDITAEIGGLTYDGLNLSEALEDLFVQFKEDEMQMRRESLGEKGTILDEAFRAKNLEFIQEYTTCQINVSARPFDYQTIKSMLCDECIIPYAEKAVPLQIEYSQNVLLLLRRAQSLSYTVLQKFVAEAYKIIDHSEKITTNDRMLLKRIVQKEYFVNVIRDLQAEKEVTTDYLAWDLEAAMNSASECDKNPYALALINSGDDWDNLSFDIWIGPIEVQFDNKTGISEISIPTAGEWEYKITLNRRMRIIGEGLGFGTDLGPIRASIVSRVGDMYPGGKQVSLEFQPANMIYGVVNESPPTVSITSFLN